MACMFNDRADIHLGIVTITQGDTWVAVAAAYQRQGPKYYVLEVLSCPETWELMQGREWVLPENQVIISREPSQIAEAEQRLWWS